MNNHPKATDADWNNARGLLYAAALRAGFDPSTADDVAQNCILKALTNQWRDKCPTTPQMAAAWIAKARRRWGWRDVCDTDRARTMRASWSEHEAAAEMATMAIYRRRSASLSPLDAVALAERHGIQWATDQILAAQGAGCDAEVAAEVAERMAG